MRRRWKPTLCPAHKVTAESPRKIAKALQLKVSGPSTSAAMRNPLFHSERAGSQSTSPSTGLAVSRWVSELTLKAVRPAAASGMSAILARDDGVDEVAGALPGGELLHRPEIPGRVEQPVVFDGERDLGAAAADVAEANLGAVDLHVVGEIGIVLDDLGPDPRGAHLGDPDRHVATLDVGEEPALVDEVEAVDVAGPEASRLDPGRHREDPEEPMPPALEIDRPRHVGLKRFDAAGEDLRVGRLVVARHGGRAGEALRDEQGDDDRYSIGSGMAAVRPVGPPAEQKADGHHDIIDRHEEQHADEAFEQESRACQHDDGRRA